MISQHVPGPSFRTPGPSPPFMWGRNPNFHRAGDLPQVLWLVGQEEFWGAKSRFLNLVFSLYQDMDFSAPASSNLLLSSILPVAQVRCHDDVTYFSSQVLHLLCWGWLWDGFTVILGIEISLEADLLLNK